MADEDAAKATNSVDLTALVAALNHAIRRHIKIQAEVMELDPCLSYAYR